MVGGLLFSSFFLSKTGIIEEKGVLGGPSPLVSSVQGAEVDSAAVLLSGAPVLTSDSGSGDASMGTPADVPMDDSYDNGAIKDPGEPAGPAISRSGLISYTVQAGDSLGEIASYFGVSVDTIASANPKIKGGLLRVGEKLNILPTSGVVYQTQGGDTLQSISLAFNVAQDKIVEFNPTVNFSSLGVGTEIIIPHGKNISLVGQGGLPNFSSEFIIPAKGYNWGILHNYNAVDIANSCGTPVVASAEGLVVPDENIPNVLGGWNGGYGNFVLIEHPFGDQVKTRYAHLEKVFVQVGDYVKQGQEVGLMGESGEATGCHVHFEIIGARNPFAKS